MEPPSHELNSCSLEPIHLLNRVQSHGILFALARETLEIVCVSENVAEYLGWQATELIGRSLSDYLPEDVRERIEDALSSPVYRYNNPLSLGLKGRDGEITGNAVVHNSDGLVIMEVELITASGLTGIDDYLSI